MKEFGKRIPTWLNNVASRKQRLLNKNFSVWYILPPYLLLIKESTEVPQTTQVVAIVYLPIVAR